MNTISATSVPIRGAMPDYWGTAADLAHQPIDLSRWEAGVRSTTALERATVRTTAPTLLDCPYTGFSILHEACIRLAVFRDRGTLQHASGHYLAQALQRTVLGTIHPTSLRRAWKGWAILAALDAAEFGVEVWTTVAPEGVRGPFTRVRLGALCALRTSGTDSERHRAEIG